MEETVADKGPQKLTLPVYAGALLIFLLPLKFGSSWSTGGIPAFPLGFEVLFGNWPLYFLTILSSFFYIFAVSFYRPSKISRSTTAIIALWVFVGGSCAAFGFNESNLYFYYNSILQIYTAVIFVLFTAICIENDPRAKEVFAAAVCAGLIFTVLNGVHQYLWGFESTEAYMDKQKAAGKIFDPIHENRVRQKLVYSTFILSNSFAAHIILTLPLTCWLLIKKYNRENSDVRRVIALGLLFFGMYNLTTSNSFIIGFLALTAGVVTLMKPDELPENVYRYTAYILVATAVVILGLTRSRASFVCFAAGLLFCSPFFTEGKKKAFCIGALLCTVFIIYFVAPQIASFGVRMGYYEALLNMFGEETFGHGFGNFSEYYNKNKGPGIDESNIPHSFFFGYLGQGGLIAGLAVILCFAGSFFAIMKSSFSSQLLKFCVLSGFTGWFFHSQLDFNIMIPGTVATVLLLSITRDGCKDEEISKGRMLPLFILIALVSVFVIYKSVIVAAGERHYAVMVSKIKDQENIPGRTEVRQLLEKAVSAVPWMPAPYNAASGWALNQSIRPDLNDIQKFEFLKSARDWMLKAIEINPGRSSFHSTLSKIYIAMNDRQKAYEAVQKALEVYPYSSMALDIEKEQLLEIIKSDPRNIKWRKAYIENAIKYLEKYLGVMRFSSRYNRSNTVKSLSATLDKHLSKLYTDLEFIRNAGIKIDFTAISTRLKEIEREANSLVHGI